jgi:hypothetical protein
MKPKSFKSKELGDGIPRLGSALYTFDVDQIELRDGWFIIGLWEGTLSHGNDDDWAGPRPLAT